MTRSEERMSNLVLRYAPPLYALRRMPVLGDFLSWIGHRLVPSDALTWVQIQAGPAQGLWIRLNPRTGYNVLHGIGEPNSERAMQLHLRPRMTMYDLGANIGFLSLIAARLVGPSGRVFSFEADPEIAARLRENLSHNNFAHAVVIEKAVWSESGAVSFARVDTSTSPDRGLGRVFSGDATAAGAIHVPAISLDDFILSHPAPDFVKCDVEGSEVAVFQGAERLLREVRPILLVEMHSAESRAALAQRFALFGYSCSDLDHNHVLALPE